MKKEINPVVAAVVIVLLVGVIGYLLYARTGGSGAEQATTQSNPMPKEAGDYLRNMMQRGPQAQPVSPSGAAGGGP